MTDLHNVVFSPEVGDVVDIPEEVGRTDMDRVGSPEIGYGALRIGVIGRGDLVPHVVVKSDSDCADVTDGSQILGCDVASGALYYAIPKSAYNGGDGE